MTMETSILSHISHDYPIIVPPQLYPISHDYPIIIPLLSHIPPYIYIYIYVYIYTYIYIDIDIDMLNPTIIISHIPLISEPCGSFVRGGLLRRTVHLEGGRGLLGLLGWEGMMTPNAGENAGKIVILWDVICFIWIWHDFFFNSDPSVIFRSDDSSWDISMGIFYLVSAWDLNDGSCAQTRWAWTRFFSPNGW